MSHPYHIVRDEDGQRTLTVYADSLIVVQGDHPNYDALVSAAEAGEPQERLDALADISVAVGQKFRSLSERVKVAAGRVFFDGDELDDSLSRHIVRCLDDPTLGDWRPLVTFMERLAQNPSDHSRDQLFDWLAAREFTVSGDGRLIAYKGCRWKDGVPVSINHGPAIVNGEAVNGAVPNAVGSTVEIGRTKVAFDPSVGCASGLHVGTWDYAHGFARGAVLRVLVDPRDVVSVPTDCGAAKVRVCRYEVDQVIDAPETAAIAYDIGVEDEPVCEWCGEDVVDGWCDYCDGAVA